MLWVSARGTGSLGLALTGTLERMPLDILGFLKEGVVKAILPVIHLFFPLFHMQYPHSISILFANLWKNLAKYQIYCIFFGDQTVKFHNLKLNLF